VTAQLDINKALSPETKGQPDWLSTWREQGLAQFSKHDWPTRKTESWKYTPLKSLLDVPWKNTDARPAVAGISFEQWNEINISIVNGLLEEAPSLPEGVVLKKLSECSEQEGAEFLTKIGAERSGFMFDDMNQALLTEGYWLTVADGVVVDRPIQLDFVVTGDQTLSSTQVLLDVGSNASVTVAETYSVESSKEAFVNANAAIFVGENAKVTHYHLLLEGGDTRHVGRVTATLNRFSELSSFHMAVGGLLKRKDITVRHRGEGAQLSLNGVYLPKGKEIIDYHTTLEHEVPNCNSSEVFRGIIGDHAKAVFNGRIHIHKDAQKSLAEMNNRNLLLSDHAEINTKPELEIYADDVKCAHGATIAQLDEGSLFYFQARGISKKEAEVMLSFGFINELLDALSDEPVQNLLRPMLATLFSENQSDLTRHLV
jgi:Fe-S cluster assembly protein SufD